MTTINATSYATEVTSSNLNTTETKSRNVSVENKNSNVSYGDTVEKKTTLNGKGKLTSDIKKGNAKFSSGILNALIGGSYKGDIYINVPQGTPMYEIKQTYNLPDGALRNYCRTAGCPGGNMDEFETIAPEVWFPAEAFAKGNNMTLEQVKALFGK